MLAYNVRLAIKSFKKNPGITALMVAAIAIGIAACVITMTLYHAASGNPIWWKSDQLYAVTLDNWAPDRPYDWASPKLPPPQLAFRDAENLAKSTIPLRHAIMRLDQGVIVAGSGPPQPVNTRVTTADFFAMFDVPFLYGGGWKAASDAEADPVIVLSKAENRKLFGGGNSVGRLLRWEDQEFRVVGVLDDWNPEPKYYDLNNGPFAPVEDVFIPYGWTEALQRVVVHGNHQCWNFEPINTFADYINADCVWIQMWVELPTASDRVRMQDFLDTYWAGQHAKGRFPRPRNNRLTNVGQWLKDQRVVGNDDRILLGAAFFFLAVCLINTVGLLLARFLNDAGLTGIRRALGASRRHIFMQHLVETSLVAGAGALLGLGLTWLGLCGIHELYSINSALEYPGREVLAHLDLYSIATATGLAIVASLAAGLYPAWRLGRVAPALYLKTQ
jgi:putative ABC transport system permease protein